MRSQILVDAGSVTLSKQFYEDGVASDPGVVTIGITDAMGDTVVAAGTATSGTGTSARTYSLANQDEVNVLYVTWTRTTGGSFQVDVVEVVGSWLFLLSQARSFGQKSDNTAPLASTTEYTNAMLGDERTRIGDELENWTGRSWIRKYARVEIPGSGSNCLYLSRGRRRATNGQSVGGPGFDMDINRLIGATVDGTAQTLTDIVIDGGRLLHKTGTWSTPGSDDPLNVIVEYEYGLEAGSYGADREALKLLLNRLVPSTYPDRALSVDTGIGTLRLVSEGGPMGNPTQIPSVNYFIASNKRVLV